MKRSLTGLAVLCLFGQAVCWASPDQDAASAIAVRIGQMRHGLGALITDSDVACANPDALLAALEEYESDPSRDVRRMAYVVDWMVAKEHKSARVRREVVERLLKGFADPEPLVWQDAGRRLMSFESGAFSSKAKASLRSMLSTERPRREAALLAGVAGLDDQKPRLRGLLIDEQKYDSSGRWYGSVGWCARLALARMGSKQDVARCIELVESEDSDVERVTRLLHHLAYIRQPEVIPVLQRYLESDERLPPVKETAPGTRFAQYSLGILIQIVAGFPVVHKWPGSYSESELATAQKWMREQKGFEFVTGETGYVPRMW